MSGENDGSIPDDSERLEKELDEANVALEIERDSAWVRDVLDTELKRYPSAFTFESGRATEVGRWVIDLRSSKTGRSLALVMDHSGRLHAWRQEPGPKAFTPGAGMDSTAETREDDLRRAVRWVYDRTIDSTIDPEHRG